MAMLWRCLQQVRAKHGWELESRSRRDLTNSVEMLTEAIERARSTESVSAARAPENPPREVATAFTAEPRMVRS